MGHDSLTCWFMARSLGHILIVSLSTFGSRVLGLLRDILMFAMLGAGPITSAFVFAFTLPNLFRRLLGEGALTSALVPVFSEELENGGKPRALGFLNQVMTLTGLVLIGLTLAGVLVLLCLWMIPDLETRFHMGALLGMVLMPYMLLVCLAAVMGAALNVLKRFAIHALTAVWLNLAMIIALGVFGWLLADTQEQRVWYLCAGVLAGGILQVIIPVMALRQEGWRASLDFRRSPAVNELIRVVLPAIAGAAIFQVNIVVSRTLALWLNEEAVSVLYLANRLVELPLGMFAVAVTTVIFPRMAQEVARGNMEALARAYEEGLRLIFAITIPAALGLALLREPILTLLFEWGLFDAQDADYTANVLLVFAIGLPFYSFATFATRGFHSLKDTRTPVKVAWLVFLVNLVLSLALMWEFGTVGLATANVVSVIVQSLLLHYLLGWKEHAFVEITLRLPMLKMLGSSVVMSGVCYGGLLLLRGVDLPEKAHAALSVCGLVPLSILVYFGVLWALRFEQREEVLAIVKRVVHR